MPDLTCALGPDCAGTLLTSLIRTTRRSLVVAMYEVGPSYAWALAAAARRGVDVRLLIDDHPSDGNAASARAIIAAGGRCRVLGRGRQAAHWKLLLADGATTAAGTGNLLWRDAPRDRRGRLPPTAPPLRGTREWWALSGSRAVAGHAAEALECGWQRGRRPPAWWTRRPLQVLPGDVGMPALQVPPAAFDVAERRVRLIVGGLPVARVQRQLVLHARRRVLIAAPYIHTDAAGVRPLLDVVRAAAVRGVEVGVLLGAPPRREDASRLLRGGIAVRVMDPLATTRGHAKGLVADDTVLVSSANWSSAGLGPNWESALLVRSPAAAEYFAAAWQRDWDGSRQLRDAV